MASIDVLQIVVPAILTAFGAALGAGLYKMMSSHFSKKNEKIIDKLDDINKELQLLLRYNLQQAAIIATILDALKSNHINGNIGRAERQLQEAQNDLTMGMHEVQK